MKPLFADTFYFIALLNPRDEAHAAAAEFAADPSARLVTTEWVMTELADGLADTDGRAIFSTLLADLESDSNVEMVGSDTELWRRGVELYANRPDQEWSRTDCISFLVMQDRGIIDALTGDHHFDQACFVALLRPRA